MHVLGTPLDSEVMNSDDMGFGGILMDGILVLQHSKSCPGSKIFQEDELKESHHHRSDKELSESPSRRTTSESPNKNESLKQEVLHLENLLETQIRLRHALEACLGYKSVASSEDDIDTTALPEDAVELIEDVAALKLEVAQLEKYFLCLHRKAFNRKVAPSFPSTESCSLECSQPEVSSQQDNMDVKSTDLTDHLISSPLNNLKLQREPALSEPLAFISKSATEENDAKAVRACHSMRLPMTKITSEVSLAKRLGTRMADFLSDTPNRLSEDMIKCMSAIYCKLSNPPLAQFGLSSPNSSSSSISQSSLIDHSNQWSPALSFEEEDAKLDNPFNVEGLLESNGPYSTLVEVPSIYRDEQKLGEVEYLLQDYQSIISRLEKVDPRKLTREEKLAFWINIHNSLVMNAFLAFGIPYNTLKRSQCLHKAAYIIGGHSMNAYTIQSSILRCRMSHTRQWITKLIPSRSIVKTGDEIKAYAIDEPEPLLYFALSSGCHSDPAVVHAFTAADIYHELETAKNEYIRATLGIVKNREILLPKLVESFTRDSNISKDQVLKTILQSLPDSFSKRVKKCLSGNNKSPKTIEWVPHNFSFRYLISKELAMHPMTHCSKNI